MSDSACCSDGLLLEGEGRHVVRGVGVDWAAVAGGRAVLVLRGSVVLNDKMCERTEVAAVCVCE